MPDEAISASTNTSITGVLAGILADKLKENGRGFYNIDFTYEDETFAISGAAGFCFEPWIKIGSSIQYYPSTGEIKVGISIGGELGL